MRGSRFADLEPADLAEAKTGRVEDPIAERDARMEDGEDLALREDRGKSPWPVGRTE